MDAKLTDEDGLQERAELQVGEPRYVRLPGFIVDQDIGLGTVIKRATSALGIKPCGSCQRRATILNKKVVFGRYQR